MSGTVVKYLLNIRVIQILEQIVPTKATDGRTQKKIERWNYKDFAFAISVTEP